MASLAVEDDGHDVMIVLVCVESHEQADYNHNHEEDEDEVMISTLDVCSWNFPSILRHRIIKVKAQKNRLIEHSSYFREETSDLEIVVQWNQPTVLSLLASLFGSPLDVTSENFLSLFEGALYFGMETILLKCKMWLTRAISVDGVPLVQLNDLVSIWEFGSEHVNNYLPGICTAYLAKNFMWAMSCSSFGDVSYDMLLSSTNHPDLTVDSEKQLCDALLVWISANKERYLEDAFINLLKQIRVSLLPLWFAAGKKTYQSLSRCYESFGGAITLLKQPFTSHMDGIGDDEWLNLRIRLTEFTQMEVDKLSRVIFDDDIEEGVHIFCTDERLRRVDVSCCAQINPAILLLSVLPFPLNLEAHLRIKFEKLLINHESINAFPGMTWPNLTFEAVHEIDIANCPMLPLKVAIEIFSNSFPSLRKLKAANHLSFRTLNVWKMVKRCPLLSDIDLSVDVSPVIPTRVSILSSFPVTTSGSFSVSWSNKRSNITKLTLQGRIDISDFDLRIISNICVSLTYISLRGCTSVSDAGISALISQCLKLDSIVACDTLFGQQSILALCSSNASYDHFAPKHIKKHIPQVCKLQMLHIGGCKGIDMTCFSKLMSDAYMLKDLCLRETQVVDDVLFSFFGSSLEVLDVSNTKVSGAGVAHVIGRNPGLKCLKTRGCSKNLSFDALRLCKLDEISVGWGFSLLSLQALKPALSSLKAIEVGMGGSLGQDGLKWLPDICPLLESMVLCFQVISDDLIVHILESLKHLRSFELCHCLGETSSLGFKVGMPNLRILRLERVAPWMNNVDLVNLSYSCVNLIHLSLLGCRFLNSESQRIISSGWPGLISIHLEECGEVTNNGVVSLFDCYALEDILLRHNGCGIQKGFIDDAVTKLPMLRKISLDICDAKDGDFDIPEVDNRHFLSHVKIARCKSQRSTFHPQHVQASMVGVHQETLVLVWDSIQLTRTVVKERV